MKRKIIILLYLFIGLSYIINAQTRYTSRVLLIALDDRPPCLQFPTKMGLIGDVELVSPPRQLLGRFTEFGQSDSIVLWLKKQNLSQFDAAIISMDMLAYGGLVASRVHETRLAVALKRLEIIEEMRKKAPKIKIYGSSVIMRLAPTGDGKNEAYREKLSRWADYSPYPENKEIVDQLEKEIPTDVLGNYKKARERNLKINLLAIELAEKKVFDYLILSQDDAKPKGIHVKDRETLIETVKSQKLSERVAIQPGADEVSMLLLARAMTDKYNYHPKIKAVYSTEKVANQVMPYEDRPLSKTVSFHLNAVGAVEVSDVQQADIIFYVFASRFDEGRSKSFADEIIDFTQKNLQKGIIIADIDPIGNVQGGDTTFTETLKRAHIFPKTYGYACWNTAGNTIGTALPHGILYGVSKVVNKNKKRTQQTARMENAQTWFMLNRLLDDYTYHSIIRPQVLKKVKDNKWLSARLTDAQTQVIESDCLKALQPMASKLAKYYYPTAQKTPSQKGIKKIALSNITFDLPWNRPFEAEIDFKIKKY